MAICVDIVPTPCGGTNKLTMKDACNDVHFTGIEDTTINQGVGIDLTEGIHAYDGNGNEIEYTVTPDSIDKCDVGEHTVVYRTIGEGDKFLPSFCMDNVDVTLGDTFCNEILLEEDRIVTITQADPPTIEGIETIPTIYPNEEFDPTEGITATDDNGKTIDFTYSGRVEDSSEGAIASFETEFEQDALSVVADIEPIQDLNGYDKPWVGGAGKNKANIDDSENGGIDANGQNVTDANNWRSKSLIPIKSGQAYTLHAIGMAITRLYFYDANGDFISPRAVSQTDTVTATSPSNAKYVKWTIYKTGITIADVQSAKVQLEEGSTATSFAPYSNICPISGRTKVVTQRTGKNLLDVNADGNTWAYIDSAGYTHASNRWLTSELIKIDPTKPCVLSGMTAHPNTGTDHFRTYDVYGNYIGVVSKVIQSYPITFASNVCFVQFCWNINDNETVMFEQSETATAYEPYQGNTYTTDLSGTVYGGTLDVVSGVLTVTHATRTFDGTEDWRSPDSSGICWLRDDMLKKTSNYEGTIIASTMPTARTRGRLRNDFECGISGYEASGVDNYWYIKAPNQTTQTPTALKAWLQANNAQVCYELATPQTIQLTPQEVELLLGQNNVWADTGDIKVIYEKEMPASGNIEYLTAGLKIITYTATDECGNQTVEQRIVYVLGDTPQVCMAEVCTAHVACEDNQ